MSASSSSFIPEPYTIYVRPQNNFTGGDVDVVESLLSEVRSLRGELDSTRASFRQETSLLKQQISALQEQLNLKDAFFQRKLDEFMANASRATQRPATIAFSVGAHNNFGPVSTDTDIPFDLVYTDLGGGWQHPTAFVTPQSGVYLLFASVASTGSAAPTHAAIFRLHSGSGFEERSVGMVSEASGMEGDSNLVLSYLEVGDRISLHLLGTGGEVFSNEDQVYVTMSGFLLYEF